MLVSMRNYQIFKRACAKINAVSSCGCYTGANGSPSLDQIKKQFMVYDGGQISLSKDDKSGIATILIDNKSKRNAFDGKMMVELSDAVQELKEWDIGKAVILRSANEDIFCSGGDLNFVENIITPSMGSRMSKLMQDTTTKLINLPHISVAVIEGSAIGGGAELCTACDFRLMNPIGYIQFLQTRLGLTTGWGGATRLVGLIGKQQALKLLIGGEKVKAGYGIKIGLVDELINGGFDQAQNWLLKMLKNKSSKVLHSMKKVVTAVSDNSVENSLSIEKEIFTEVWGGPDHLKALKGWP